MRHRAVTLWTVVWCVMASGACGTSRDAPLDGGSGGAGGGYAGIKYGYVRSMSGIAYANGKFVAAGAEGPKQGPDIPGAIYVSTDGLTWTRAVTDPLVYFRGVAFGNGRFVVVGGGISPGPSFVASARAYASSDGQAWTGVDVPNPPAGYGIAFGNGVFISPVKYTHARSADGTTWAALSPDQPYATAVAFAGGHFVSWSVSLPSVRVSPDGDWQTVALPGMGSYVMASLRVVNDAFVGILEDDCCYGEAPSSIRWGGVTSTDGLTWTATALDLAVPPPTIVLDEGSFCLALGGDRLLSGPGCDALTPSFIEDSLGPHDAVHAAGLYVVTCGLGILTSPDGFHWTRTLWSE
jgi:hypothetical protein